MVNSYENNHKNKFPALKSPIENQICTEDLIKISDAMDLPFEFDVQHYRLLSVIYNHPEGLSARSLVEELKARGWCDPTTTAEDLGLHPDDILRRPRAVANDP